MIEPEHPDLSVRRQCNLVGLASSSYYYHEHPADPSDADVMSRIDRIFTATPFYGVERILVCLRQQGLDIGPKRVRTLMRRMELMPIYAKPRLSQPGMPMARYPYLLKGLPIERPDQVWATDVTWVRMGRGYGYLCAVIDLYSRYVVSWALSNTQEAQFCIGVLEEALATGRRPEIFNTDQGSQFTCADFVDRLLHRGIRPSWDGKGRWVDNVFVERFWRTVKYECVYLHAWVDLRVARSGLADYIPFYNYERPHQSLDDVPPAVYYFGHPQSKDGRGGVARTPAPLPPFQSRPKQPQKC